MIRGYRVWDLEPSEVPRLTSPMYGGYSWVPGENVSSLEESEDISESSKGFYSLKSPAELVKGAYYPSTSHSGVGIAGEIIPYGKVVHGEQGYRSSRAEISTLFEEDTCDLCGTTSKYLLKTNGSYIAVCEQCYKRIHKALPRSKKFSEQGVEEALARVSSHYGVPIREAPDVLKAARLRRAKGRY